MHKEHLRQPVIRVSSLFLSESLQAALILQKKRIRSDLPVIKIQESAASQPFPLIVSLKNESDSSDPEKQIKDYFHIHLYTRTWTATDASGNASQASQTINVQDITAPVIAALPGPSTIDCPAAPVFAQATAVDDCGV